MQLSWPREGDRKRAMRGSSLTSQGPAIRAKVFLNTSSWNTSLSLELEYGRTAGANVTAESFASSVDEGKL